MRWRGHHQSMNVIFYSTHLKCSHLVLSGDAADVRSDARFDPQHDPGYAILGAESEMVMQ